MTISVQDYRQALSRRGAGDITVIAPGVGVDMTTGITQSVDPSLAVGSTTLSAGESYVYNDSSSASPSAPSAPSSSGPSVAQEIASITGALAPIATTGINVGLALAGKKPAPVAAPPAAPWSTTKKVVVGTVVAVPVAYGLYKLLSGSKTRRGRRR